MGDVERHEDVGRDDQREDDASVGVVQQLYAAFSRTSGPAHHPIFEKFESEHVTQFLSQAHETDQEERDVRRSNRWFHLGYTILGLGVFVFLTVLLLPKQSELYTEIMKTVCIFAGGVAGGYGLKAYQDQRKSQDR